MKKIILFLIGLFCFCFNTDLIFADLLDSNPKAPYCQNDECGIEPGILAVEDGMKDQIETEDKASEYIQKVVIYLLSFITILAVFYVIYAGFNILTSAGEEEKVKKSKTTIVSVLIGIIIIWLSYTIVKWIMVVVDQ